MKVQRLAARSLAAAMLVLTALLAACAAGPGPPGERAPMPPNAARGAPKIDPEKLIYVTPVEGAPGAAAFVLADAVAAALRDHGQPAVISKQPNASGATVAGRVEHVQLRFGVDWLTVSWRLLAPYGTAVAEVRQQVVVDADKWRRAAPEAINLLLEDATPRLVRMVASHVGPTDMAAAQPSTVMGESKPVPGAKAAPTGPSMTGTERPAATGAAPTPREKAPMLATSAPRRLAAAPKAATTPSPAAAPAPPSPSPSRSSLPAAPAPKAYAPAVPASPAPVPSPKPATPEVAASKASEASKAPTPTGGKLLPLKEKGFVANTEKGTAHSAGQAATPPPAAAMKPKTKTSIDWSQPAFTVRPVTGAPGNGNEALTAALKSALRARDLTISDDPRQAGFVIQGKVDVAAPVNGRQDVRITWKVSTIAGQEVGKAVQQNNVVAGTLDGEWGRVAKIVADAAVSGIQDLFGSDKQGDRPPDPSLQLPDVPTVKLPNVPGRAPPPPGY